MVLQPMPWIENQILPAILRKSFQTRSLGRSMIHYIQQGGYFESQAKPTKRGELFLPSSPKAFQNAPARTLIEEVLSSSSSSSSFFPDVACTFFCFLLCCVVTNAVIVDRSTILYSHTHAILPCHVARYWWISHSRAIRPEIYLRDRPCVAGSDAVTWDQTRPT
jgi:hypothetical protein